MMNHKLVLDAESAVRLHCRQFQRRQVMPRSSRQIISPGSAYSITGAPSANRVKGLRAGSEGQLRNALVAVCVLATERCSETHTECVVEIDQWVDGG